MSETTQPETAQEETTAGKPLSRQEQARAALAGRRNKNRQVPLTQPAQSIPVSYLGDAATAQPSTGAPLQSFPPVMPQQSSGSASQGTATTVSQGNITAPSLQDENALMQEHSLTTARTDYTAASQESSTPVVPKSTTAVPLQSDIVSSQQSDTTLPQPTIASVSPGSNITAASQLGTPLQQQDENALPQPTSTASSPGQDKAVPERSGNAFQQQQNIETSHQPTIATLQDSNAFPPQSSNVAMPLQSATLVSQKSDQTIQQERSVSTEQENSFASPSSSPTAASGDRDSAISRYRDETTVTSSPIAEISGSSSAAGYQSSGAATIQPPNTTSLQGNKVVAQPSANPTILQEDTALIQQENKAVLPGGDGAPEQESDPAATLKSMFAAVPEGAIAELMQALLVQPRVNDENKSQWRSGGMQVTYGTHKKYKLLADQYGVHMRDIVEQTLKACLPFWRAQLQHLREIGALSAEEAEDELY